MSVTLAAQLYTVRQFIQTDSDFAASMKKIRAIGYRSVQISGIGPIPDAQVKSILDDNGLTVCITHVRAPWPWQDLDAIIAQHRLWKCKHVGIPSMPPEYRASEDGFKQFAAQANAIGAQLDQAGLTLSYHNHSFEFVRFGKRTGMEMLFEETDPRYLMALLDTYWIQHGGADPVAWIKKMTNRMPVVHLKDMAILDGKQVMAEVGEGNMNWDAILRACEQANVEWYTVEQDVCQRDPFESLKISYANLKAMGQQ